MKKDKKKKDKKSKKDSLQAVQLKSLESRFGLDGRRVNITLPLTATEFEAYFGPQCEEFSPTCIACKAFSEWHFTGKATISFSRNEILGLLEK